MPTENILFKPAPTSVTGIGTRSPLSRIFAYGAYLVFSLHLVFSLERQFFVNEVFAVLGVVAFLVLFPTLAKKDLWQGENKWLLFVAGYMVFHLALIPFYPELGTPYQILRTTAFTYSFFCFFVGVFVFKHYLRRSWGRPTIYERLLAGCSIFFGGVISPPLAALIGTRRIFSLWPAMLVIALMLAVKFMIFGSEGGKSTLIIIFALVLGAAVFKGRFWRLIARVSKLRYVLVGFALLAVLLLHLSQLYANFFDFGFEIFPETIDVNLYWRLMFWVYLFTEVLTSNPITGLGLGTPLFDAMDPAASFILASSPHAQHIPFTIGPHNSFFYLFVRFGLVGFVIFMGFFSMLVRRASVFVQANKQYEPLLLAYIAFSVAAAFNVVLESPLYSGSFWFFSGLLWTMVNSEATNSGVKR